MHESIQDLANQKPLGGVSVYVLSLSTHDKRKSALKVQFPTWYPRMHVVDGLDVQGLSVQDYFEQAVLQRTQCAYRPLGPTELACRLGHIRILERFLASNDDYALVLEDDVLGTDDAIDQLLSYLPKIENGAVLIGGGQEGLSSQKKLFVKPTKTPHLYCIEKYSYDYVLRTCCCAVTRRAAELILHVHQQQPLVADAWGVFGRSGLSNIYFSAMLRHPSDLEDSRIQLDRELIRDAKKRPSILVRLRYAMLRRLGSVLLISRAILRGASRAPKGVAGDE